MKVLTNDAELMTVFSAIYDDMLARQATHLSIVYQNFGTVWNLALRGDDHSVNIGETWRAGDRYFYVQPRKPWAPNQKSASKHLFNANEVVKMSYLTTYYLMAVRGAVNMPDLNECYPDMTIQDRRSMRPVIEMMDQYINL